MLSRYAPSSSQFCALSSTTSTRASGEGCFGSGGDAASSVSLAVFVIGGYLPQTLSSANPST